VDDAPVSASWFPAKIGLAAIADLHQNPRAVSWPRRWIVRQGLPGGFMSQGMAYGVDPTRSEYYSLRQARYHAIGEEVGRLIPEFIRRDTPLKLLDVGFWNGVSRRYIEVHDPAGAIEFHGVDLNLHHAIYKRESWNSLQTGDLLGGLPFVDSNRFDVVICEQVLEHLPHINIALATLNRVLKPGGRLILGVPIFPRGVHLVRRHLVPWVDKLVGKTKPRSHLQVFSRSSFETAVLKNCDVDIVARRGFRIMSGGLLRPLENLRWWWQLNRTLGEWLPGLCTELQLVAIKRGAQPATASNDHFVPATKELLAAAS
jgi:SAM-dependent methyltransferase